MNVDSFAVVILSDAESDPGSAGGCPLKLASVSCLPVPIRLEEFPYFLVPEGIQGSSYSRPILIPVLKSATSPRGPLGALREKAFRDHSLGSGDTARTSFHLCPRHPSPLSLYF